MGNDDPMILLVKCITLLCREHGFIMFVFSWWTSWGILLGLFEPIKSDNQTTMILRSLNLPPYVYFPFQEKIQLIKSFIQYPNYLKSCLESEPERYVSVMLWGINHHYSFTLLWIFVNGRESIFLAKVVKCLVGLNAVGRSQGLLHLTTEGFWKILTFNWWAVCYSQYNFNALLVNNYENLIYSGMWAVLL